MLTRRILLIDSQQNWLKFAKNTLTAAGFDIEVVPDIESAQHLLSTTQNEFALILASLDSVQEDTATFPEIARTESGRKRRIVVLFPTELTPANMSKIFRLGAHDCVNKRYGRQGLLNLVMEQLADYDETSEAPPSSSKCERKTSLGDSPVSAPARARPLRGFACSAAAWNIIEPFLSLADICRVRKAVASS